MKAQADFGQGGLLAFWNSMTPLQRGELVKNLRAFHCLVGSLRSRKIILTDKRLTEITIIKKTPETEELKRLHKTINAGGIKIIEEKRERPKKTPSVSGGGFS